MRKLVVSFCPLLICLFNEILVEGSFRALKVDSLEICFSTPESNQTHSIFQFFKNSKKLLRYPVMLQIRTSKLDNLGQNLEFSTPVFSRHELKTVIWEFIWHKSRTSQSQTKQLLENSPQNDFFRRNLFSAVIEITLKIGIVSTYSGVCDITMLRFVCNVKHYNLYLLRSLPGLHNRSNDF